MPGRESRDYASVNYSVVFKLPARRTIPVQQVNNTRDVSSRPHRRRSDVCDPGFRLRVLPGNKVTFRSEENFAISSLDLEATG